MFAHNFVTTRTTLADPVSLLADVRTACGDPNALLHSPSPALVYVKKQNEWTEGEIAATQAAIESAQELTPQRQAMNEIEQWPISLKALVLAIIDQINVLRANDGLSQVTAQQALAAIRNKAANL